MNLIDEKLVEQSDAAERAKNRFSSNREREWGLYGIDTGIHNLNMLIGG